MACHAGQSDFVSGATSCGFGCPKSSLSSTAIPFSHLINKEHKEHWHKSRNSPLLVAPMINHESPTAQLSSRILSYWFSSVDPWCLDGSLGLRNGKCLEFFSGTGRVSRLAAKCGIKVGSFEMERGFQPKPKKVKGRSFPQRNSMDFNGESGFAFLDPKKKFCHVACSCFMPSMPITSIDRMP